MTRLTKRRRQVAILASRGLSNRQIAEKLRLTVGTVKVHLHAIFEKLNLRSRTDLKVRFRGSRQVTERRKRKAKALV